MENSRILEVLRKPVVATGVSVLASVLLYALISAILDLQDNTVGYFISITIPILVAFPVSLVIERNFRKTELQKKELERLDLTNKKLFSVISHDIRSPISSLRNLLTIIEDETLSIEDSRRHFRELSNNIDQLLDFMNDLLIWSKHQIENKPLESSFFNCKEVIDPVLEMLETAMSIKNLQLVKGNIDQYAYCDKEVYSFIFRNILHNAVKFSLIGGVIEVYTLVKSDRLQTVIRDSGIGISEEELKKVLDDEVWYTKKGTNNEAGTGFGLSTCAKYLAQNNGELIIKSKVGVGTKVIFEFPISAEQYKKGY